MEMSERLYFRQLLAGRDFATADPIARQMVNFVYLIGDRETGEAVVVDPAYDVRELVEILGADGMRLTGALATHYHPDHVGGDLMGYGIEGVRELLAMTTSQRRSTCSATRREWVHARHRCVGLRPRAHDSGDVVDGG